MVTPPAGENNNYACLKHDRGASDVTIVSCRTACFRVGGGGGGVGVRWGWGGGGVGWGEGVGRGWEKY